MPRNTVPPMPATTLVIFGAMGDLTRRLLVPALINLLRARQAGNDLMMIGVGIEIGDDDTLRKKIGAFHPEAGGGGAVDKGKEWAQLQKRMSYLQGDFEDDATYAALAERIGVTAKRAGNVAFYLAVQPRFFQSIVIRLAQHGLMTEAKGSFRRVAIEKPFGSDLASARKLNASLLSCVREDQIYRIDHFLGKESVQNIAAARFSNTMIEGLWNANFVDHVQITVAETVDVGTRGTFYDATGALRDMVPNHLFQLLANVAMEPPNSFDAESIRDEKSKVLKALRVYTPEQAAQSGVRGVYSAGKSGRKRIDAYADAAGVARSTKTETFVALKLWVDNWRWAGVPFYLRTGKVMAARETEVVVTFKQVPNARFANLDAKGRLPPDRFVFRVEPDEALHLNMLIRRPGIAMDTAPVSLDFRYADCFDIVQLTGYESLFYDLFTGDQTLFQRADAIEASWAAVQPFMDLWEGRGKPERYSPGTMGPAAADALLENDGRSWYRSTNERAKAKGGK